MPKSAGFSLPLTYVSLKGYKHGEIGNGGKKRVQNGLSKITLDEIAQELNMSKSNLKRALRKEVLAIQILLN